MEPPEVLGLTLKLIYHEALDEDSVPAAGDYTVTAANGAVTTTLPVTAVGVKGNTVTLTLARAPGVSQMVTLRYTALASNPVRDLAGNDAEGLTESRKVKSVPTVSVGAVYPAVTPRLGDPEFRVTVSQAPESDLEVALSFEQTEEHLPETTATITVPAGRTSANRAFGISSPHSRGSGSLTATVTGATLGGGTGDGYAVAPAPANAATVPVLADEHDEGSETLTFRLTNPVGARIADDEAVGTIRNAGAIPKAWIARFGRTVAEQVLDAVEGRMRTTPAPGVEVSLAGQRLDVATPEEIEALERREAQARLKALGDWLEGGTGEAQDDARAGESRALSPAGTF